MFRKMIAGALLIAGSICALHAQADEYPSRPVRIILPFPAGGPTDVLARALAQRLAQRWSQSVIVENRPGAYEIVGTQALASAPPDGYTLMLASDAGLSFNSYLFKKLPYDPIKDIAPISLVFVSAFAFAVPSSSPANTLQEFVEMARRAPGKLNFGSAGPMQLYYTEFAMAAKIDQQVIPFSGMAPVMPELLASRLDSALGGLISLEPQAKAGKLKLLAVGGKKRSSLLPQVPTFAESGYPDVDVSFFSALVAPAGTPSAVINKVAADVRAVMVTPGFKETNLDPFAMEGVAGTPDELASFLVENRRRQEIRVKLSGLPQM